MLETCALRRRTSATTQGSMGMVVRECTGKEPTSWSPKSTRTSAGSECFLAVNVMGSIVREVWKLSKALPLFCFRPSNLFYVLLVQNPGSAARSQRGVGPGRAGARGQLGAGLGGRDFHRGPGLRAGSRRKPGGEPWARLPPLLRPAEDTRDPAAAAAAATGTAAAAAEEEVEEEVSARGSRFLLAGWASAGEARGGQDWGISRFGPPGPPRGTRRPLSPLHRVTAGAAAGTGESQAAHSCCTAGPPRPRSPARFTPS